MNTLLPESEQKKLAALEAIKYVQDHQIIGLGSGSTAEAFIKLLGESWQNKAFENLVVVSSSTKSATLASSFGLLVEDPEKVSEIDLNVDGTDETDIHSGFSVKGGGNALHREKMIALKAKQNIFIAEQKKAVEQLGAFGLPIEIGTFDAETTAQRVALVVPGATATQKMTDGEPIITDNGNYMLHLTFPDQQMPDPENLLTEMKAIEGVFSVGLFLHLANKLIIGQTDGHTRTFEF
jgi:ribose 5-phosphate isomerase A